MHHAVDELGRVSDLARGSVGGATRVGVVATGALDDTIVADRVGVVGSFFLSGTGGGTRCDADDGRAGITVRAVEGWWVSAHSMPVLL